MSAAPGPEPAQDPPFGVNRRAANGTTIVSLEGDLDLVSAHAAGEALTDAQAGGTTVLLDLSALRFIDSSGLRVVLEAQRRAATGGEGARLQVAPGQGEVRRVFEVSGVGALLTVVDPPPPETSE